MPGCGDTARLRQAIKPHNRLERIMEAERINLINNQLVGLTERVHELRGYL
jgi:hypothetical protein